MPKTTAFDERQSELLAVLRARQGPQKLRKRLPEVLQEKDEIIEDFVENTITAINNTEGIGAPIKARLVEGMKVYIEENRLPDDLPPLTPPKIKRNLEKAQRELKPRKRLRR